MINGRWVSNNTLLNNATRTQRQNEMARTNLQRDRAAGIPWDYAGAMRAARAVDSGRIPTARPPAPTPAAVRPTRGGTTSSGGGRGYGGGGGGGGGVDAAKQAQAAMDFMAQFLGSGAWTAPKQDELRKTITDSTAADVNTANTAWNAADAWLAANQSNPYQAVQLQQAQVAPDQNAFLTSQGAQGQVAEGRNPNDGYGGFQNALALLAAGQNVNNTSTQAGAQTGRASSITGINALDNAMLAGVTQRETDAQTALDNQKRETIAQLLQLIMQGAKAPNLHAMGIFAPGGNAQDPHGWAEIARRMAAGR